MSLVSEKNNFLYLVVSLVILLLVGALLDQLPRGLGKLIFQAITVITVASSVIGFRSAKFRAKIAIGITLSTLVIVVIGVQQGDTDFSYLHLLILIGFYSWLTWLAAQQVLFSGPVDGNKIVGAICIYLLIGLIWALVYLWIAQAVPGAFTGLEQEVWYDNFAEITYFSYVTLTTLGYGDISPVTPVARFFVYMEAIVGVFYMAVLVASLIGIRASSKRPDGH